MALSEAKGRVRANSPQMFDDRMTRPYRVQRLHHGEVSGVIVPTVGCLRILIQLLRRSLRGVEKRREKEAENGANSPISEC